MSLASSLYSVVFNEQNPANLYLFGFKSLLVCDLLRPFLLTICECVKHIDINSHVIVIYFKIMQNKRGDQTNIFEHILLGCCFLWRCC